MRWLALLCGFMILSTIVVVAQTALTFPPPKVEPPDDETTGLIKSRGTELEKAIESLVGLGVRDPHLADIELFHRAGRMIATHNEFYKNGGKQTVEVLNMGLLRVAQQKRGSTPWLTSPAGLTVIRGYRSRLDGCVQPYAVSYPADYGIDRKKRYRIDINLHGRNAGLTEVGFIAANNGKKTPADQAFVLIDVFGRGNNAYRWAGEIDVAEALENFITSEGFANRSDFIDSSRIVLRGFSMGGAGTWHIGLHRPDQFRVIGPGAGFTTTHGYTKLPENFPDYQEACLKIYDAVEYAENAFNVPIVAYSGEDDPQKKAADNIEARLKKLGLLMTHHISPKTGHTIPPEYRKKLLADYAKHASTERDEYPGKVIFTTYTMRYHSCYWVELVGLEKHYTQARVEVSANRQESSFQAKTTNVRQLRLGLWPGATRAAVTVEIDGQTLEEVKPYLSRSNDLYVYLEKREGKWASVQPERIVVDRLRSPQKVTYLQGPIDDAFMGPFVCVRPTGTPWHERTADYANADLARFQREWSKYFRGDLLIKDDKDITAEDIAMRNLILFGDPSSNRLIAQTLPRLPLQWTKKSISLAGKEYDSEKHVPVMIYPSPLATDRYVVLNSGHTFHEPEFAGTNALLFPRLGDYAVLLMGDKKDPLASEVQLAGLFDDFWRVPGGGK